MKDMVQKKLFVLCSVKKYFSVPIWKQQQHVTAACSCDEVRGTGVGVLKEFNQSKNGIRR